MKNNLRRLSSILADYTDAEIKAARKYNAVENILVDRFIGMLRGKHQTDCNGTRFMPGKYAFLTDAQQRDLAETAVQWFMGRELINIDKVDLNYCRTQTTVGIPEEDDEELNK